MNKTYKRIYAYRTALQVFLSWDKHPSNITWSGFAINYISATIWLGYNGLNVHLSRGSTRLHAPLVGLRLYSGARYNSLTTHCSVTYLLFDARSNSSSCLITLLPLRKIFPRRSCNCTLHRLFLSSLTNIHLLLVVSGPYKLWGLSSTAAGLKHSPAANVNVHVRVPTQHPYLFSRTFQDRTFQW